MGSDRFRDRVVVVTGGGSGQGAAASRLFASEGAKVVVADWNEEAAAVTAKTIVEAEGDAVSVRTDVSSETAVRAMIDCATSRYGRLDVLFNNAAVGFSSRERFTMGSVVDTPDGDWDSIVAINLKGAAMGCKHAIPVMVEQGGGAIVNNSSVNGIAAVLGADAYTAAKGGVVSLTRSLAVEWAPKGLRVNCLCPGGVETPMIADVLDDAEFTKSVREDNPMRRLAQPEEIAEAALFLASDAASYINGVVLPVDGGWTAR